MAAKKAAKPRTKKATRDEQLIADWEGLDPDTRQAIKRALERPTRIGSLIPEPKHIKTTLGFVVFDRFVTPLAREMIEAVEFNGGKP